MIYLDNAATSYPKPATVINAVNNALFKYGANPGRSGHNMSVESAMQVFICREKLNAFFNGFGCEFVSFYPNCTYALNVAIKGVVKTGDHIVISSLEHNSVLRPVHKLKTDSVCDYSVFEVCKTKEETLDNFKKSFKNNTKLCVVTSVSNVFGDVLPLKDLADISHKNGAYFFVDGAQGAGVTNIDMKNQGIDCLCVPGHKGLLGPMGTGALLHKNLSFNTIFEGGTGTSSFDFRQPEEYPERLESGTLNVPGICGLTKGIETVERIGRNKIFDVETMLSKEIFYGLKSIQNIVLYSDDYDSQMRAPIVSFNVKNMHSEQVADMLNRHGFAVRGGYHCAPLAHISRGTKNIGAVRISPSFNTSEKDIKNLLNFARKIAIY